ncbi:hypothetical protein CTAYLR_008445 [Chrysophaeum taylorii]|uniref:Glycosyl transferase family 25 domain-containing protein n=1 Tax=Chrysophaeum taylorii TaxID=2483200 RepID=A0AAD7UKG4_9STRA|nr:hypothetical protein CTAYLR_008445 [Chrysophaeum taylorii]
MARLLAATSKPEVGYLYARLWQVVAVLLFGTGVLLAHKQQQQQPQHAASSFQRATRRMITKAYYINCDSSPERRAFMEGWLETYIKFERFACVEGNTLEEVARGVRSRFPKSRLLRSKDLENATAMRFPWNGSTLAHTVGCYASHYLVLEHIARQPAGNYLVLEDDASPRVSLSKLFAIAATLPTDWVYAGLNTHDCICEEDVEGEWALRRKLDGGNFQLDPPGCTPRRLDFSWGADAFYWSDAATLVNTKTLPRVLDRFDHNPIMANDEVVMMSEGRDDDDDDDEFPSLVYARYNLFSTQGDLPEARDTSKKLRGG